MSLFQVKKGTWAVRYYPTGVKSGGRRYLTLGKMPFEEAEKQYIALLHASHTRNSPTDSVTLTQVYTAFLDRHAHNLSASSIASVKTIFKHHLNPFFGDKPVDSFCLDDIEGYKKQRLVASPIRFKDKTRKVSQGAIILELAILRSMLNKAVELRIIKTNPIYGIKFKKGLTPNFRLTYFEPNELRLFFDTLSGHFDPIYCLYFRTLYLTGNRLNETVQLNWFDCDFKGKTISIYQPKVKDRKELPLDPDLEATLLEVQKITGKKDGPVFVSDDPLEFKSDRIYRVFKKALKLSGITKELSPHSVRHTTASHLVQASENLFAVQKVMGHADPKTTMRYAHLDPKYLTNTMSKLSLNLSAGTSAAPIAPENDTKKTDVK